MRPDPGIAARPDAWNDALSEAARLLRAQGRGKSAAVLARSVRPVLPVDDDCAFALVRPQFRGATPRLAIARHVGPVEAPAQPGAADVVGILSPETARLLGRRVLEPQLRFDGYDLQIVRLRPAHLVVETSALRACFGWQHALTLGDPSATAELAALVRKARSAGIGCVLLHEGTDHRFPLVSRIADLFHHVLPDAAELPKVLNQAAAAA